MNTAIATQEICDILANGQFKTGMNPLAILDGFMSGDLGEAVFGGTGAGTTSAMYAKAGKLSQRVRRIPMDCSVQEALARIMDTAQKMPKRLMLLRYAPTANPYIAYYSQGIMANPTMVVVEVVARESNAEIVLTAFTAKVGFVRGHSCHAAMRRFSSLFC